MAIKVKVDKSSNKVSQQIITSDELRSTISKGDLDMYKETKLVIRSVGQSAVPTEGVQDSVTVQNYLDSLLADGWQLLSTMYLGEAKDAVGKGFAWEFAWMFVR
jgi:hypothetical protein